MIILTEGHSEPNTAKTATSILRYKPEEVVAVLDSTQQGQTSQSLLGVGGEIPVIGALSEMPSADTLAIGIAPPGGRIPPEWRATILEAITLKMNVVSGLHDFIGEDPEFTAAAAKHGVSIYDVRKNSERDIAQQLEVDEKCLRIHTVGNDCSVGKMVVSIEVQLGLSRQGHDAQFVATGQTGIMIEGTGCPVDCVVADFINGAAEKLVIENQQHDIILIEGQGSLFHPSYSAVTLGLLHGSQPDGLILCYEVGRKNVKGLEHVPLRGLAEAKQLYETMASVMHPCKVIGVAMNSRKVSAEEAAAERIRVQDELNLPVCDVIRDGADDLCKAVLELKGKIGK